MRLFLADYDRALRLRDQLSEDDRGWDLDHHAADYWAEAWSHHDEEHLEELRAERRGDHEGRGIYGLGPELACSMRRVRESQICELEGKLLLDQRPGLHDRPGGAQPMFDAEFLARHGLPDPGRSDLWEMPGHFWVSLPPETSGSTAWERALRGRMKEHRARWPMLPRFFAAPLGLDIAIEGAGSNTRDVDNAAHAVLGAFEELYCGGHRGAVVAYRAYRRAGTESAVRVKVLSGDRLRQLEDVIDSARNLALARGSDAP